MMPLDSFVEQFVRERTYLHNVTPKTRDWYQTAWKAFKRFQADVPTRPTNAPLISRLDLQQFVVHLRERGRVATIYILVTSTPARSVLSSRATP
jgi:hypothetical protein